MEATHYVPPIFLVDDDVISFDSIEHMVRFIEPCDVSDDVRAFDAAGRRLVLRASGVRRTRWTVGGGESSVDFEASGEVAADELADGLRNYLCRLADRTRMQQAEVETAPLHVLVAAASYWSHTQ
jgi:hypothetical protein